MWNMFWKREWSNRGGKNWRNTGLFRKWKEVYHVFRVHTTVSPDLSQLHSDYGHFSQKVQMAMYWLQKMHCLRQLRKRCNSIRNKKWSIFKPDLNIFSIKGSVAVLRWMWPRLSHVLFEAAVEWGAWWRMEMC